MCWGGYAQGMCLLRCMGSHVVTLLNWTYMFEWYMGRFVIKNRLQTRCIMHSKFNLCVYIYIFSSMKRKHILSISSTLEERERRKTYKSICHCCNKSTLMLKFDMTIYVILLNVQGDSWFNPMVHIACELEVSITGPNACG